MPASPAMRFSPGREPRGDNHKRGRSLENGVVFKERDDDLALFNEVQSRERDDFLLQTNDDFEDSFVTKLRHFQDHKLGINNVSRGESSDLLNTEDDKNDYEWLLTPPDTPLFPSLDDEAPQIIVPQRGRPRAQPISISRSSTMEKNHRSSRASPSPNRVSPSSRSRTPTFQPRNRTSRTPSPSPPPSLKPTPESKRPSYPSKPSSPTSRRLSTGSPNPNPRGISPAKTTRPNSSSPKIKSWQANIPGFSKESPPNLRTSLHDRPASYIRGSSPASRRQSKSPTPSRSIGSSHSNERDRFSVYNKGSVASSGDEEIESQPSVVVDDGSERLSLKKVSGGRNSSNKVLFSQKVSRPVSSSSAPKRSFDLALRQMDHKRVPQNMFRPLLSSVPSTTFYPTKGGPTWNSSVTTSSNASSELNTSGAHDNDENDLHHEDDATSELYGKVPDYNIDNEVFVFEKTDSLNQDMGNETNDVDFAEVDRLKEMLVCLKCGCRYYVVGVMEDEVNLCVDCRKSNLGLTFLDGDRELTKVGVESPDLASEVEVLREEDEDLDEDGQLKSTQVSHQVISQPIVSYSDAGSEHIQDTDDFPNLKVDSLEGEHVSTGEQIQHAVDFPISKVDFPDSIVDALEREGVSTCQQIQQEVDYPDQKVDFLDEEGISMVEQVHQTVDFPNSKVDSLETEGNLMVDQIHHVVDYPNPKVDSTETEEIPMVDQIHHIVDFPNPKGDASETECISTNKESPHTVDSPNPKVDFSEKGLPIIIKPKNSITKGPLFRSGTFSASSISYDDLSYARASTNSMRSSIGRGSMSTSSSVDFGRFNRQSSTSKKSETENYKYAPNAKHQRSTSSVSATSSHAFHPSSVTTSTPDSFDTSIVHMAKDVADVAKDVADVASVDPQENENENFTENDDVTNLRVEIAEILDTEEVEDLGKGDGALMTCTIEEEGTSVDACVESTEVELGVIAEGKVDCAFSSSSDSECNVSEHSETGNKELEDTDVATTLVKDIETLAADCETSNHSSSIVEESTVLVEGQGGTKGRSLTLEEATETILFCSSIVHNLAYQAATIALEKPILPEPSGNPTPSFPLIPTVTTPKKDVQNINTKPKPKTRKTKQKKTTEKASSNTSNTDEETDSSPKQPRIVYPSNNKENMKPPKLESKCNCVIM